MIDAELTPFGRNFSGLGWGLFSRPRETKKLRKKRIIRKKNAFRHIFLNEIQMRTNFHAS